uniref:Leucine-rich repeat-containing N-terminal plant-type domain-containing protein n=1 Tax=Guillardia theta TaxID=55529 RepID=A0A7S4UKX0_GUITH
MGVFDGLSSLERLDLSSNSLETLEEGVFDGLSSLRMLDLSNNQISSITAPLFSKVSSLRFLDLSHNKLSVLPQECLDAFSSLDYLYLENNPILQDPRSSKHLLKGTTSLRSQGAMTNVTCGHCIFHVSQDGLLTREGTCGGWGDCSGNLDLRSLSIRNISVGVFDGLSYLWRLYLSENQLSGIPQGAFTGLSGLGNLHLTNNQLTSLSEGSFAGLPGVGLVLFLDGNQMTTLSNGVFSRLTGMRALYLEMNQLSSIEYGSLSGLSSLIDLRIRGNRLSSVPKGAFDGKKALELLDLSYNELTMIPEGTFNGAFPTLWALYLNDNKLTCISSDAFVNFTAMTQYHRSAAGHSSFLSLTNNALTCRYASWPSIAYMDPGLELCRNDTRCVDLAGTTTAALSEITSSPTTTPMPDGDLQQLCSLNMTWFDIGHSSHFITGGLGALMNQEEEVWVCQYNHPWLIQLSAAQANKPRVDANGTAIDAVCFIYNEISDTFRLWGIKSELGL